MKNTTNMNEIININKQVWIPCIEKAIYEWIDFSKSIFCEKAEDRLSALERVNELMNFLYLVKSNTLTRRQFEEYYYGFFW